MQLLKESTADALLTGRVRVEVGERIHDQLKRNPNSLSLTCLLRYT